MDQVKKYLAEIGARGGRSRSQAKIAAGKKNAAKATAARIKKFREKKIVPRREKPCK